MPETPDHAGPDPFRAAVVAVVPPDLRAELAKVEAACAAGIAESVAAKERALELIRTRQFERPFEFMEADLEKEHAARVAYHRAKLVKKVRWVLEAWADMRAGEDGK